VEDTAREASITNLSVQLTTKEAPPSHSDQVALLFSVLYSSLLKDFDSKKVIHRFSHGRSGRLLLVLVFFLLPQEGQDHPRKVLTKVMPMVNRSCSNDVQRRDEMKLRNSGLLRGIVHKWLKHYFPRVMMARLAVVQKHQAALAAERANEGGRDEGGNLAGGGASGQRIRDQQ
jgi:hypothetical protein